MAAADFELGLNSFGEVATDGDRVLSDAETVRLLVDEARLAESAGLDVFSVGEHYREGHNDSATPVLLAAAATATERIRLGTSVTVLSTNDPVRLYHEFSTLDAVSDGRAQIVLGRASATESFPLFGYDLADYERLFEEKLDLFAAAANGRSRSPGRARVRSPLDGRRRLHPRMPAGRHPDLDRRRGKPGSVVRAARHGLPLMLAIIGGRPQRFAGARRPLHQGARTIRAYPAANRAALTRPCRRHRRGGGGDVVARTGSRWWRPRPPNAALPTDRARYEAESDHGALFVGSPETVARRSPRSLATATEPLRPEVRHHGPAPRGTRAHHPTAGQRGRAAGPGAAG